ncbi:CPBP family intramembrane glutamic endopeptidase [Streptomyces sp. DH37]|uniref:CPBP family intramembrane glutamic endopeptidase n=1 Tax=Streptomyces sp. DH37 TaxID=3040122 RepID=UPI002442BB21|nr:CPBP family intramembrane metalloprotease [Streptomyces sp. DH37]MDG9706209.1 CPBP family intramembrane metalloprotease [Streptomyces sp. DH37]
MAHSPPNTTAPRPVRRIRRDGTARTARPGRPADARRAERDLWRLLLVACAVPLTGSAIDFARLAGAPVEGWSGAVLPWLRLLCSLAAGCWLAGLLAARPAPRSVLRPRTALALTAVACAARVVALVRDGEAQGVVGSVATTVLLAWLCGELAGRHGGGWRGLGIAPSGARTAAGRLTAVMVFGAVFVLAYTTVTWMAGLQLGLPTAAPWLPVLDRAQSAALGWNGPADMVANVLFTGVAEEMVLVGAVVVLGRAAGRPLWAACAISLLLRVAAHLYLGVPGVALLLLGSCALFLYLRYRRLTPLVAGHIVYDLTASFVPSPEALNTCALVVLLGTGTAFAAWLLWFSPPTEQAGGPAGARGERPVPARPRFERRSGVTPEAGHPDGAVAADGSRA